MNKIFQRTRDFILQEQANMLSSSIIISVMIVIARIFGLLRYRVLSGQFTVDELDIYYAAFRLPDLMFEILITGALTTTFIPFFLKFVQGSEKQSKNVSTIINLISCALVVFLVIAFFSAPSVVPKLTPAFSQEKITQTVWFSQILLLGQLPFFVFGSFLSSMSQARKSFLIPAMAPVMYNIGIMITTVLFSSQLHLMAPICGVVIGAICYCLIQLPSIYYAKLKFRPFFIEINAEIRNFFKVILPRLFTVVIAQVSVTFDLYLASFISSGAYTVFYYAQQLQLLPVSIIGIAYGQASLPYLAEMYRDNKIKEMRNIVVSSVLNLFFLIIPFMYYFIFARTPLVRLVFGGAKFDWDATVATAFTVSYFALSLPAHAVYYFLTRCFYAMLDSKTPFHISLLSVLINSIVAALCILVFKLPVWYLGLAFSLGMTTAVLVLFILLYKRLGGFEVIRLLVETTKIVVASAAAAIIVYGIQKILDGLIVDTSRTINLIFLLMITFPTYALLYFSFAWLLSVREMAAIGELIGRLKHKKSKVSEVYNSP